MTQQLDKAVAAAGDLLDDRTRDAERRRLDARTAARPGGQELSCECDEQAVPFAPDETM